MIALTRKIIEESKKSRELREIAWDVGIEKAEEIRKEQKDSWEKFNFYKNLAKAYHKIK